MAKHVLIEHASQEEKRSLEEVLCELKELDQAESSLVVTGWLTSAVRDRNPQVNLQDLFRAVSRSGTEQLLDALSVLPILVPCPEEAAEDILSLVSECTSAKEVVIASLEVMEHLHASLNEYDSEGDLGSAPGTLAPALQLKRVVSIYAAALPRLTLRRKCPAETLESLFSELDATLLLVSQHVTVGESRELAHALAQLFNSAASWYKERTSAQDVLSQCKARLRASYENTMTCIAPLLQASLAPRAFTEAYPRLSRQISLDMGWKDGADALECLMDASSSLDLSAHSYIASSSIAALIYLGSLSQGKKTTQSTLAKFVPVVMACLQSNMALDTTLSYLCSELVTCAQPLLDAEDAFNLAYTIALVSASHPDATMRLITFRLLSLCIALLPPLQRLDLISGLLASASENPPQLRVAAVGLAREAVLHALAESLPNLLSSRHMLFVLTPILFQTEPVDLLQDLSALDAQSFLLSVEPKRLTECLSFYYVVWARDTDNRTGIRDHDKAENIEKSFFAPLRAALHMLNATEAGGRHEHEYTLAGLQIGLERIADIVQLNPAQSP